MKNLDGFVEIAPYLKDPLVLAGFITLLLFTLFKSLLKLNIIKYFSKDEANKLVRLILKYGFVISLFVIIAGFLMKGFELYTKSNQNIEHDQKEIKGKDTLKPNEKQPHTYFNIKLILSSDLSDAEIFIDGNPALIIEDHPIIKEIKVIKKSTPHKIEIRKGTKHCTKEILIYKNNQEITPCQ